jgi:CDP-paratose 2-epimerase
LVGSETVKFLCKKNWEVVGLDNDMRGKMYGKAASTKSEGEILKKQYKNFHPFNSDIRNYTKIAKLFKGQGPFDFIVHTAAQPAHEWSTNHALEDFQINAVGTVNVLEAYRRLSPEAKFIHCSTSKVYGDSVNDLPLQEHETRFDLPKNHPKWEGEDESMRLDGKLHSLFGASKASADIMAREYGTYFNLPITSFRPVCISGPAHKGARLHGYLAYLVKCVATGEKYIINGYKGKQVRDNIHSFDLVSAFWQVYNDPKAVCGEFYNIGGGRESNNSILEAIAYAEKILGKKANVEYSDVTRRGDHKWCIYSAKKFRTRYPKWKITYDNDRLMKDICKIYLS